MKEPRQLKRTWSDGAHCGLTDWYDTLEEAVKKALKNGPKSRWTTGWFASKKEIASAKITSSGLGIIDVEVSVSDDFDTPGIGSMAIEFTRDLDAIKDAITKAWEDAEEDQKDNRCYMGFSTHRGSKHLGPWTETLILPTGDGFEMDRPPGDNYSEWGWQGDTNEIPVAIKKDMRKWAESLERSEKIKTFRTFRGQPWTIKEWD